MCQSTVLEIKFNFSKYKNIFIYMNYIIIHVGKCSGTVLRKSLKYHKISFKGIHHENKRNPVPIIPNNLTNGKDDLSIHFLYQTPNR